MRLTRVVIFAVAWAVAECGCGGGGRSPVAPPPPPVDLLPVNVVVFYDEDADGVASEEEVTRLGEVVVRSGSTTATSARITGRTTLNLPAGQHTLELRPGSLPPYFRPPAAPISVTVPVSEDPVLPATLPIGSNRPHVYVAAGDSITVGDGATNKRGYVERLEDRLLAEWLRGEVFNRGHDGGKSNQGADLLPGELSRFRPAVTLIMYGTNDWNHCDDVETCYTQDSIRTMLRQAFARESLPFLATIIPANTGFDARTPPSRNEWNEAMNARLKAIAAEEGATVVDLYAAFTQAAAGDLSQLFDDHVHPNDRGHDIIADEFFRAITSPAEAVQASLTADPALLANPPGGLMYGFDDEAPPGTEPQGLPLIRIQPLPPTRR